MCPRVFFCSTFLCYFLFVYTTFIVNNDEYFVAIISIIITVIIAIIIVIIAIQDAMHTEMSVRMSDAATVSI